jgi:hypothetical protein
MTETPTAEINREQSEQLFEKLRSKTQAGELKWKSFPSERAAALLRDAGVVRLAFEAEFAGARFLAIDYDRRSYFDSGRDDYTLIPELSLSIFDDQARIYEFPYARGLSALFDTIKAQVFQIPALIERILQTA